MGSPTFHSQLGTSSPNREITFDLDSAQPPINQYVGKDDQLFVMVACSTAGAIVTIFARMMMPDGTLQQNQWQTLSTGSRQGQAVAFPLPECFLLSASAIVNTLPFNTIYVQLSIARGIPSLGFQHLVLCKGYANGNMPISWPWGVNTTSLDCAGAIRSFTGTTPGAGAEISETVPIGAKWRLRSFNLKLTTTAVAGAREIQLFIDDGTNVVFRMGAGSSQIASLSPNYSYFPGGQFYNSNNLNKSSILPIDCIIMPGYRIRTSTVGIDVGDQYSAVQYEVEEWLLP